MDELLFRLACQRKQSLDSMSLFTFGFEVHELNLNKLFSTNVNSSTNTFRRYEQKFLKKNSERTQQNNNQLRELKQKESQFSVHLDKFVQGS